MGKQGNSTSSIALLQERFRELQRVKEMREERELMKRFADSRPVSSSMNFTDQYTDPGCSYPQHPRPPARDHHALSLGLDSQRSYHQDLRAANGLQHSSNLWARNTAGVGGGAPSRSFENPDVDTSLHL